MKPDMKKRLAALLLLWVGHYAPAQTAADTTGTEAPKLTFSAFADVYYLYDLAEPADHERPPFLYSHSRHNEFALNNALLSAAYTAGRVRANLGLHAGTYVQRNYAAEELNGSEVLKLIYQANAGVRLARGLWLDAGIMPSHIGYESALSIDNPTLTRSLMAENTPYYEAGAKLTWDVSEKLTVSGLVLNGWQRIVETDRNKAVGTQIQYKPAAGVLLNSSTFLGREGTGRYFHNFYGAFDLTQKITLVAAFDVGWQAQPGGGGGYRTWYNPNLIVRYKPTGQFAVAGRVEYYHDPDNLIIAPTDRGNGAFVAGFQTVSPSLNVDYFPAEGVALRLEGRYFTSRNAVFTRGAGSTRTTGAVAASIAFMLKNQR